MWVRLFGVQGFGCFGHSLFSTIEAAFYKHIYGTNIYLRKPSTYETKTASILGAELKHMDENSIKRLLTEFETHLRGEWVESINNLTIEYLYVGDICYVILFNINESVRSYASLFTKYWNSRQISVFSNIKEV